MIEPSLPAAPGSPHGRSVPDSERLRISRRTTDGLSRQSPAAAREKIRQLRGTVRSGVERTSQVLVGPEGELLAQLLGGPAAVLADGQTVLVTGVFITDLHTTVQQGRPFRVDAAETDPDSGGSVPAALPAPFPPVVD